MSKHSFPAHKILVLTDYEPASMVAMGFARVMQLADAPLLVVPKY